MTSAAFFAVPVITALNHVLDQADWARKKLQPFSGRSVRIAMSPLALTFSIDGDGHLLSGAHDTPDLDIVLPAAAPLLAMQGNAQLMKSATISGPADFADTLGFVLRNLEWDVEEDLSKIFGDVVAHRIAGAVLSFVAWHRQAARNLAENVGEYLVEENPTLARPAEVIMLTDGIEQLRADLARIETRINQLEEKRT